MILYIILAIIIVRVGTRYWKVRGIKFQSIPYSAFHNSYIALGRGSVTYTKRIELEKQYSPRLIEFVFMFHYFFCLLFWHTFWSDYLTVLFGKEKELNYKLVDDEIYFNGIMGTRCVNCGLGKPLKIADGTSFYEILKKLQELSV